MTARRVFPREKRLAINLLCSLKEQQHALWQLNAEQGINIPVLNDDSFERLCTLLDAILEVPNLTRTCLSPDPKIIIVGGGGSFDLSDPHSLREYVREWHDARQVRVG